MTREPVAAYPFAFMNFSPGSCFLCGATASENSREHVLPLWLLRRQSLLDATLTLLNGTTIPYRQVTIPCCLQCNNEHLSRLEGEIEEATRDGAEGLRRLQEERVFQWMAKIFIGILWAELSLKAKRSDSDSGPIVTQEMLADYRVLHGHLQSVRRPVVFEQTKPWSLFISDLHKFERAWDFDYHDSLVGLCFAIRFSGVGIIACLQDNSAHKEFFGHQWQPLEGTALHWLQWEEMWAKVLYARSLFRRTAKFLTIVPPDQHGPAMVLSLPPAGYAPETMWAHWDNEQYANLLLKVLGPKNPMLTLEALFLPPDRVMGWLFKEDGTVNRLTKDGRFAP